MLFFVLKYMLIVNKSNMNKIIDDVDIFAKSFESLDMGI